MNRALPSIITSNYLDLRENLKRLIENGMTELHLDVMDGAFVPNITFGHKLIADIHREFPRLLLNTHLMVSNPVGKIDKFIEAGCTTISVHMETLKVNELKLLKNKIQDAGIKFGIAVGYQTNVNVVLNLLNRLGDVDTVLVMSVMQGAGGQKFDERSLDKIEIINRYKLEKALDFEILIDGGINANNYRLALERCADKIVVGNAIFKDSNIEKNYAQFDEIE